MPQALIHAGLMLLGAFIAWYGVYLGRTGKAPLEGLGIRIANTFKRAASDNGSEAKHEETISTPRRGM